VGGGVVRPCLSIAALLQRGEAIEGYGVAADRGQLVGDERDTPVRAKPSKWFRRWGGATTDRVLAFQAPEAPPTVKQFVVVVHDTLAKRPTLVALTIDPDLTSQRYSPHQYLIQLQADRIRLGRVRQRPAIHSRHRKRPSTRISEHRRVGAPQRETRFACRSAGRTS